MPSTRLGRRIRYRDLTIHESPFVYPVKPEVPEALDRILDLIQGSPKQILELGSGCGIIACALAADGHSVLSTDIHSDAVSLTARNARANGLQLRAIASDLFEHVEGMFDLIVFNIPNTIAVTAHGTFLQYVGARLLPKAWLESVGKLLARGLAQNTPSKLALLNGILSGAQTHLKQGGMLVLLVQRADLPHVQADERFACIEIFPLQHAEQVRLVILAQRDPARAEHH